MLKTIDQVNILESTNAHVFEAPLKAALTAAANRFNNGWPDLYLPKLTVLDKAYRWAGWTLARLSGAVSSSPQAISFDFSGKDVELSTKDVETDKLYS